MDKYDKEIEEIKEELKKGGEVIYRHWVNGQPLFAFVENNDVESDHECGCLTQVKKGQFDAQTASLTKAIRLDDRIPSNPYKITLEHLPVFAEWQRRIDKELNRA